MAKEILIISTPNGPATPAFRQPLVGCIIEIDEDAIRSALNETSGGRCITTDQTGYLVMVSAIVAALRKAGSDAAATYWNGLPAGVFRFNRQFCQPIND
ncbi:MAG: hypothetical protein IPJ68_03075 [Candidatus Moraniibacteriota bacterium]|nr:MAG: hypothetical protein IPJ68_03075 [Candidatus Moranbacteria bacterium]